MEARMDAQEVWLPISCYAQKREINRHAQNLGEALDPAVAGSVDRYGRKTTEKGMEDGGIESPIVKCLPEFTLQFPAPNPQILVKTELQHPRLLQAK